MPDSLADVRVVSRRATIPLQYARGTSESPVITRDSDVQSPSGLVTSESLRGVRVIHDFRAA